MDDVKHGYRETKDTANEQVRKIDGESPADTIGNLGDDARDALGDAGDKVGNLGDDAREALGDAGDKVGNAGDKLGNTGDKLGNTGDKVADEMDRPTADPYNR